MPKPPPSPQPQQPIVLDEDGTTRFQANTIVRYLLDEGRRRQLFTIDQIWWLPFSREDLRQFYQLLGYSVGGYGEIFCQEEDAAHVTTIDHQAAILLGHRAVTEAILDAERQTSVVAWRHVAACERELAELIPSTELEGQIARRGVITALVHAGDRNAARAAAAAYALEHGAPPEFTYAIAQLAHGAGARRRSMSDLAPPADPMWIDHDARGSRRFRCPCGELHEWPPNPKPGRRIPEVARVLLCTCGVRHVR
jgi:hypothetical protein